MSNQIKEVEFYGDKISAILDKDDKVYVSLKQLVGNLGLAWKPQYTKILSHPVFSDSLRVMVTVSGDASERKSVCIPADMIPGYILTINPNKLSPELQVKMTRYHREAFRVLSEVFMGPGFATHPDARRVDTEAMQARAKELAKEKHALVIETINLMKRLDPNYSSASLNRMLEVSTRTNLLGELVQDRVVLDVGAYLVEKGISAHDARKMAPAFGKALKSAYVERHGKKPAQHSRFVDGAERKVYAYTEHDRELFDEVFDQMFEEEIETSTRFIN